MENIIPESVIAAFESRIQKIKSNLPGSEDPQKSPSIQRELQRIEKLNGSIPDSIKRILGID